eukprot:948823-Amorphochlora_amoeboformis.AAC.1
MDLSMSKEARAEREHEIKIHYKKLAKIRPTMNTRDPVHVAKLQNYRKKRGVRRINRHRNVKFANGKLVKQITAIACRQRNGERLFTKL